MYRDTRLTLKTTVTGKNRAIPGLHRDKFPGLTGHFPGRLLSQVTFTHPIAVPLGTIKQITMNITNELNQKGLNVFINPKKLYAFEDLICGVKVKGKTMAAIGSNTYRGFHKIDKLEFGAKYYFENCIITNKKQIIKILTEKPNEKTIDALENEIVDQLKFELRHNIINYQLKSYNKLRKPIDLVLESLVAMINTFNSGDRKSLIPLLFLPLDSQMFGSPIVFSDNEMRMLNINRSYTFKDIVDTVHYSEIQSFLKEKAEKIGLQNRIFFDLLWNDRYKKHGDNLFETNI